MPRKAKELNLNEQMLAFTAAIRKTVQSPTIAAYKPLPHQEKFHSSKSKGKLFIGGNRSGKTVGGGAEAVMWLTGRHTREDIPKPPLRGRAIGVDFLQGIDKIILPEIKKWMPPGYLKNGNWDDSYNKQNRTLILENGSFIEFLSYDQETDQHAGTSRHFIWFDEEPPEHIFNENMLRLADVDGSWWLTMTPLIDMSWTFDRLYEPGLKGKRAELEIFEVATSENTYVKKEVLDRVLGGMDEAERKARTEGTYINHTGLVYKGSFNPQINILEDVVEDDYWPVYHGKWGHFLMLDHGYTNPTAVLFACYDEEGRVIIYDEIYQNKKLVSENAEDIRARIKFHKIDPAYIVGDPSIFNTDPITGTSIAIEYAENGIYISPGNNDVRGGITRVQHRFKEKLLFITKRCPMLLWELNRYRWDKFASAKIAARRSQKETPLKKDDHALDALRYGIVSRPALDGEIDMKPRNVLNLPEAGERDYDWALSSDDRSEQIVDEFLGTEY